MPYGARSFLQSRIRGLCLSTSADVTELPDDMVSLANDVDFDGLTITRRLARSRYNSAAPIGAAINGLFAWYRPATTNRYIFVHAGTAVYADLGTDASFSGDTIATGLTGGQPMDFWIWRDSNIYFGSSVDSVRKSVAAGASSVVAPITAPATAPTVAVNSVLADDFDADAWTSPGTLATAYVTTIHKEGTGCLEVTADAAADVGDVIYRAWTLGATVDLSEVKEVVLWVQGNLTGTQFQVGVYADGVALATQPTWGDFPVFTIDQANVWKRIRIPLDSIKPADRDASPGLAIKFVSDGGRGFDVAHKLYFDDAKLQGLMTPDRYAYYYTYADTDGSGNVLRESAPSPVAYLDLSHDVPFKGVDITPTASGDGTVDQIRIYRRRDDGFWSNEKMVKTRSNASTLVTDVRDDGAVDMDPLAVNLIHYRNAPPLAATYCLSGRRLYCGGAGGVVNRVYVSAFNDPEAFSPSEMVNVTDPNAAGWFDLPKGETVRRIVDFDGQLIIFTERSIYSLQGDGWDNFNLQLRATVGLDARWAVAVSDRLIYFLSGDGIRVVAPNYSFDGDFQTWKISEPVDAYLEAIPNSSATGKQRQRVCMGIDERGRLHVSFASSLNALNNVGLIFDPRLGPDCLAPGLNKMRPGWTYYTDWGFSMFHKLNYQLNDEGQMIGAEDSTSGYVDWVFYKPADIGGGSTVITDSTLQWAVTGRALDSGLDRRTEVVYLEADMTLNGATALMAVVSERNSTSTGQTVTNNGRGAHVRTSVVRNPRIAQAKIYSDGTATANQVYSFGLGYYVR